MTTNEQAERDAFEPEPENPQPEPISTAETPVSDGEREKAPEDVLAELKAKADENWDKYVRAAAELENVRKRSARDVEKAHRFGLERFSADLLAVRDSLEMGLATGGDAEAQALLDGSAATLKLLATTMERYGVAEVDPLGEPFDPEVHEAMTVQPSNDVEPGSVLAVYQKGYTLNGRLLRPARVVVAEAPPAAEADDD